MRGSRCGSCGGRRRSRWWRRSRWRLGSAPNSAIFALVDATLLRPLPFPDAGQLVMAWEQSRQAGYSRVAPPNLVDWNERSQTMEGFAGYRPVGGMVMNGADGKAETVSRQWVTSGFFSVLGVKPIAGRTFLPSDNKSGVEGVVLSEAFWEARFGRDPNVIGRPHPPRRRSLHRGRRRAQRLPVERPDQPLGDALHRSRSAGAHGLLLQRRRPHQTRRLARRRQRRL